MLISGWLEIPQPQTATDVPTRTNCSQKLLTHALPLTSVEFLTKLPLELRWRVPPPILWCAAAHLVLQVVC